MANVTLKMLTPSLPAFIQLGGAEDDAVIDIANIPVDQLKALGEEWTEDLIRHAKERAEAMHNEAVE